LPTTEADDSPTAVATNVWKERQEFYTSALPKDETEEQFMLQLALEESQRQQRIRDVWQIDVSQL